MVYRIYDVKSDPASGRNTPPERPAKTHHVSEPPYEGYHAVEQSAYRNSAPDSAIVIDNGTPHHLVSIQRLSVLT